MNQAQNSEEDENKKSGEGGTREGFKQAFRRRIFQIYFELMKERNNDLIFAGVLIVINFMQIYGLLYNSKISFPFYDDLYNTICSICDLVRIYPLIEGYGQGNGFPIYYWVISFGLIVILVIYILLLIFVDYSIKIEKFYFTLPVKLLRLFNSIVFWVFLMPIIQIFIGIFSCGTLQGDTSGATYHVIDNSLQCWTGIHIFYCILFSITLFGYFLVFSLIAFFYNESRPYHTDALARLDTNFETQMMLYKIIITIIGHFVYQQQLHWLIITIHVLGALNFCNMYLQYLPYYNNRTSILFGAGWFIYLWLALNVLLAKALNGLNYQGQSEVILIGVILLFPAVHQIRESKIQKKIFTKKHDKIKSEYELDLFIHKLHRLIIDQHVDEVDEMILLGLVHNHQSECLNSECPLNNAEELYLPLTDSASDRRTLLSKDPILLYHLINSIYAEYAKSSNSSAVLHTTYAYFLFYQIGNNHMALLELNVAEKCDTNFQQKFTVYRAKRFIENFLVSKFGRGAQAGNSEKDAAPGQKIYSDLDVTIVLTFESLHVKLSKEIEKSANDHIEFWSHLDSQMVDLNVLHKLGLNIINNTKRINEFWSQLTRINPNYPKALQIYGNYLVQIKNDNTEGEEFLIKANHIQRPKSIAEDGQGRGIGNHQKKQNDFEMMFAEDTAIVVISGNKDSQAKIMKTNNGITKLFGYNTFEVHGHEVNILMPPIIGVKHNYFLDSYFRTGRERVINQDISTFAMLRAGHIFAINLIVKPVPSLKNDIQYIGLIKPICKEYDYIITDKLGRIDSISQGITSMLQLQPSFFKENEVFLQVICPQLCEVERIKGSKEYGMKFDMWNGVRDLSFIIPRNFSSLSQKNGSRLNSQNIANTNVVNMQNSDALEGDATSMKRAPVKRDIGFVGLQSPDHLKKLCNMFRNSEHKQNPQKYMQTLKTHINYDNPEIYRGPIKTEIINNSYGSGYLTLKVFKLLNPKKKGALGISDDSDSGRGLANSQGNKNVRALIEETNMRIDEFTSEELQKRIIQMKQALEQVKKGIRHPSARIKPSNIITPNTYEAAEIQRYKSEIKQLEYKLEDIKAKELAENITPLDLLQMDNFDANFQAIKNKYPLRDNNPKNVAPIDISQFANFANETMMGDFGKIQIDASDDNDAVSNNMILLEENDEDFEGEGKIKFKVEEDRNDLLREIRAQKKILPAKKKVAAVDDGAEDQTTAGQNDGVETPDRVATPGEAGAAEEKTEDEKFLEEDNGSVASSTKSLAKHLSMLRNALYENYLPPSINNLKINAKIVFVALLIITIVWYVYAKDIYTQLQDNIHNIHSSYTRMNSLIDIGADVRILQSIKKNAVSQTRGGYTNYTQFKCDSLLSSATLIQQSQNNLSSTYLRDVFTADNNNLINPSRIKLIYNSPIELTMFYYMDIWSAIMTVSVHALNIKNMALSQINRNSTSVFVILTNVLNNILSSINDSTKAILQESSNISDQVNNTLLILLIVASCSLFISLCLIFPVATKVDKNKDELLKHFMLINRDDVKKQLEKCRIFFNTMHDKEHVTMQNIEDDVEEEFKEDEGGAANALVGEGDDGHDNKDQSKKMARSRKKKMHKPYSSNFISLIVRFLLVVTVLEGYFVLCYFQAGNFLSVAKSIIQESGTITTQNFGNNFLYQIMQEVLTTNGTAQVMNQNSLQFIFNYLNHTIQHQEDFLNQHSANSPYHSAQYNTFYNNIVLQDVCDAVYDSTTTVHTSCSNFMGGILMKGLYSANVAYWDNMRSMATDFNNSARDQVSINTIMNSNLLVNSEYLKDNFFNDSYKQLLAQLDLSIFYNFNMRHNQDTILFAVYIVILFLLYFILWNKFMETTRHSLWVTKSMLAIIPLDIIQKVPMIKDFLLASSRTTYSAAD